MPEFLRLVDPASQASFITLNVVAGSFRNELEWQGEPPRRSFEGQMLSTQRDPRHVYTMQIEILTPEEVEAFILFVASATDPIDGRPLGYRNLLMASINTGVVQGARRGKSPLLVTPELGPLTVGPDYALPGVGVEIHRITQTWLLDLTLREAI